MLCEYYNRQSKVSSVELALPEIFNRIEKARLNARKEIVNTDKSHVLYAIRQYSTEGELEGVQIYRNMCLSDKELDEIIKKTPLSYFDVLHRETCRKACEELLKRKRENSFINIER